VVVLVLEQQRARGRSGGREMPGGASLLNSGGMADSGGGLTVPVVVTCLMAASGGLIFGYDIGISGAPPPSPLSASRVCASSACFGCLWRLHPRDSSSVGYAFAVCSCD
jgi:hypothetical protein